MNKRTRLIVSLLFIVLIILAVAITRFYVNSENNPAINGGNESIDKIILTNDKGYSIFSDNNGDCGISDSGRILASPEWSSIEFAADNICVASKKSGEKTRYGCIDYEGNVIVPLIYSKIEKKQMGNELFYFAVSDSDKSVVIYNELFAPVFSKAWSSCDIVDDELQLSDENGCFVYNITENGIIFKSANIVGNMADKPFELNMYSRVLLSKLTPTMIEKMTDFTDCYIEYVFGSEKALKRTDADLRQFKKLFPEADEITKRKLTAIPEVHIYSVGSENGIALYDVSVSADVNIEYIAENGAAEDLGTQVKATVRFRGNYETGLEAVSGSIEPQTPDYPQEETTAEVTNTNP